jgi:hypothetical protein
LKNGSNVTTLDVPAAQGNGTFGSGINDQGAVAGFYLDSTQASHGFIWHHGTFATVDVLFFDAVGTQFFSSR